MNSYRETYNEYEREAAELRKEKLIQENIEYAIHTQEGKEGRYLYRIKDYDLIKKIEKDTIDEFNDYVYFIKSYNKEKGNIYTRMAKSNIAIENYKIAALLQKQRICGSRIPSNNPKKRRKYIEKVYKKEFYKLLKEEASYLGDNTYISETRLDKIWNESINKYENRRKLFFIGKIIALVTAASIGGMAKNSNFSSEGRAIKTGQESVLPDGQSNTTNEKNRLTYTGSLNNSFIHWANESALPGKEFKEQVVKEYNEKNNTNIDAENVVAYSGTNTYAWVNDDESGVIFHQTNEGEKRAVEASYNFLADENSKKIIAIYGTTKSNLTNRTGEYCSFYIDNLIIKKTENESTTYDGTDAIDLYNYALEHTSSKDEALNLLNNYQKYFSLIKQADVEKRQESEIQYQNEKENSLKKSFESKDNYER